MGANHMTGDSLDKRLWNGHILQEAWQVVTGGCDAGRA
jgi:hypothetical protein